jgi:alanine dehydrogenase
MMGSLGVSMKIGVPKEIKVAESRVGLTPEAAQALIHSGHSVLVQSGAGAMIGCLDEDYLALGAEIANSAEMVFAEAEMIVKVKEPQSGEVTLLKPEHLLFTYLHLAASQELTQGLMSSGCTAIAYETVRDGEGRLPLLAPMSQVAGRMAAQVAAEHLMLHKGGEGRLLGGVPGVALD